MDNKHLTRAKDRATGEWVVGYYIGESVGDAYIIEPSAAHECDPETVGMIAPVKDTDGKTVFEGDVIEFKDDMFYFRIKAVVKFGEYLQDGSGGEYNGAKVYGWHIEVLSATLPEWDDDDSEYPAYLKIQSILNIPSFKVVGNKWDN